MTYSLIAYLIFLVVFMAIAILDINLFQKTVDEYNAFKEAKQIDEEKKQNLKHSIIKTLICTFVFLIGVVPF